MGMLYDDEREFPRRPAPRPEPEPPSISDAAADARIRDAGSATIIHGGQEFDDFPNRNLTRTPAAKLAAATKGAGAIIYDEQDFPNRPAAKKTTTPRRPARRPSAVETIEDEQHTPNARHAPAANPAEKAAETKTRAGGGGGGGGITYDDFPNRPEPAPATSAAERAADTVRSAKPARFRVGDIVRVHSSSSRTSEAFRGDILAVNYRHKASPPYWAYDISILTTNFPDTLPVGKLFAGVGESFLAQQSPGSRAADVVAPGDSGSGKSAKQPASGDAAVQAGAVSESSGMGTGGVLLLAVVVGGIAYAVLSTRA